MKIWEFSIKRPITIFMSIIAVILFGVVSFGRLNLDMLPNLDMPMAVIVTQSFGKGPEDIEEEITKPIEKIISTVSNVKSIKSVSSEGSSNIIVQFEDGTDMNFASLDIREKIDMIKGALPKDIINPMIIEMDPSMMPIINFGVGLKGEEFDKVSEYVQNVVKPAIESIDGVASLSVIGDSKKTIEIDVNNEKLINYGISTNAIAEALRGENLNSQIGSIVEGDYKVLVRSKKEIKSLKQIEDIGLKTANGQIVKLKDIGKIKISRGESDEFAKINGNNAIIFSVQKESTANTVEISKKINEKLDSLKEKNSNLEIIELLDQGSVIQFMVNAVSKNAVVGGILAIIVLLVFLKDIRSTIIMAVSIPISIIATFIMIYFGGLTLNMISLGGMALGVGMLVDNSIVVIESIYRYKKLGCTNEEAAKKGTFEVSKSIMASTLTTICVFLPIVFVQGMAADIFKEMALTVTFSLISSLIVSFTLVPVLASKLLNEKSLNKENNTVLKMQNLYGKFLKGALNRKKYVLIITFIFIIISFISLKGIGMEFFPSADQGMINIELELPEGTKPGIIDERANTIVERIKGISEISTIGMQGDSDGARILLILNKDRNRTDKEISREVREKLKGIAGTNIEVKGGTAGVGAGKPISLSIIGDNFKELESIENDLFEKLKNIQGVTNIESSLKEKTDELVLDINNEKATEYGLSGAFITQTLKGYFKDTKVTDINLENERYELVISQGNTEENTLEKLKGLIITSPRGVKIPMIDIVNIKRDKGYSEVYRIDQKREVNITADTDNRALNDVVKDIENEIENYNLKEGYEIKLGGEVEQMKEAFSQMLLALVLAIILVYMVMASQFESLINPFIIMFTVPLAFAGAIMALFLTNVTISIPAMIGFVMLTGIIVNNGIVLIDFINKRRKEGMEIKEAIVEAGKVRLQPILMTSLTTIIGLLPMALGIGEGNEIQLPLAMTVIGGLTIGTVLTLVVIPVIYSVFNKADKKIKVKK